MFSLIVDVIFRPISAIPECIEKTKVWESILLTIIIILANMVVWRANEIFSLYSMIMGMVAYLIFYGTMLTAGGMYLGRKMNFTNNYAFPYVLLPFSLLSSVYITFNSPNTQYMFIIFVFAWEAFLETIYVKYSFKNIKIVDSVLIVIYSYLMRLFIISAFLISTKFYWLR